MSNNDFLETFGSQLELYNKKNTLFATKFRRVLELIQPHLESEFKLKSIMNVAPSVWKDLGIYDPEGLFVKIQRCRTYFGMATLFYCLSKPLAEKPEWSNAVKQLISKPSLLYDLRQDMNHIHKIQTDVLWFWETRSKEEEESLSTAFYTHKYLIQLNRNRFATYLYFAYRIILQPLYTICSPLACLILPIVILRYKLGIKIPIAVYCRLLKQVIPASFGIMPNGFPQSKSMIWVYASSILSTLLYVQSVYSCVDGACKLYRLAQSMKVRTLAVNDICQTVDKYAYLITSEHVSQASKLWYLNDTEQASVPSFLWKHWCFSETGKLHFGQYLYLLGKIDCLLSISEFFIDCKRRGYPICFPEITSVPITEKASLYIEEVWHPYLLYKKIIPNSVKLGGKDSDNNDLKNHMMITGPNAGGKSTLLKAISLNVFLSQSLGISTASTFTSHIFHSFYTHLRIPDIEGEASLFQEELNRSAILLQHIKQGAFFAAFDELFASTSIEEGVSCAYSLCEEVAKHKNGISIVATHYEMLTKIPYVMNCQMRAYKTPQGIPVFTYKLGRGVSNQRFALDLLEHNIDTRSILLGARRILDDLLRQR
jgi:hypothetical protein